MDFGDFIDRDKLVVYMRISSGVFRSLVQRVNSVDDDDLPGDDS